MKKAFIFSIVITVLGFIAATVLYPYLPESIPIHWNVYGVVDNYGDRIFIFLSPAISLIMTFGLYFLPGIVPRGDNIKKSGNAYPIMMAMLNLLMAVIIVITATSSFGIPTPVNVIIPTLVGVLMLVIGNYLPKIKPNYSFGIRLPWTLANDLVWSKTHRVGGKIFFVIGLLFIGGIFFPPPVNFIIPLAGLFAGLAIIAGYAYVTYRKTL